MDVSVLLYRCTYYTLKKCIRKKVDDNHTWSSLQISGGARGVMVIVIGNDRVQGLDEAKCI